MLEVHFVGGFAQAAFEDAIPDHLQSDAKEPIVQAVHRLQRDFSVFHSTIDTIGTTLGVGDHIYRVILSRVKEDQPTHLLNPRNDNVHIMSTEICSNCERCMPADEVYPCKGSSTCETTVCYKCVEECLECSCRMCHGCAEYANVVCEDCFGGNRSPRR